MPTVIFPGGAGGGGGGADLTIQEEGADVQTSVNTINFVGADVKAESGGAGIATVYIPTPTFASHFNTQDGTTDGRVNDSGANIQTRFISSPTAEGNPYNTGGWAGTNRLASNSSGINLFSVQQITAVNGSTFEIQVLNPDSSVLQTYTTPAINGAGTFESGEGGLSHISVFVTNYEADSSGKFKANISITVRYPLILTANGLEGGRFNIIITQTVTDGTGPYVFNMATNGGLSPGEFFYDSDLLDGSASGISIAENVGQLAVKHLSGIEYYIIGNVFTFTTADIDNFNRNTVLTASSFRIIDNSTFGFSNINQSPITGGVGASNFTGWTSQYDVQNVSYSNNSVTINRGNFRFFGNSATASTRINHSWDGDFSLFASASASILVDTYGTTSTDLTDNFNDEARRLQEDYTSAWVSANILGVSSDASCQIELTGNLSVGNTLELTDEGGINRIFVADTDFAIAGTSAGTAQNIATAVAASGFFGTATVSPYAGYELYITVTQASSGPGGNRTNNAPTGNLVVTDFTDGSNDALVMRSYIQDASTATFSNGVTANPDWSAYKPDSGGANPNYTTLFGPASYYRTIVDATGLSRSSFEVTFVGRYNNANVSNFTQYLSSSDLKFFLRKVNSSNGQGITGTTIPPMRLHGGTFGAFDQGKTIDGSYCRTTTTASTTIQGTFGIYGCVNGFYLEIQITDPLLKIDSISVVFT